MPKRATHKPPTRYVPDVSAGHIPVWDSSDRGLKTWLLDLERYIPTQHVGCKAFVRFRTSSSKQKMILMNQAHWDHLKTQPAAGTFERPYVLPQKGTYAAATAAPSTAVPAAAPTAAPAAASPTGRATLPNLPPATPTSGTPAAPRGGRRGEDRREAQ